MHKTNHYVASLAAFVLATLAAAPASAFLVEQDGVGVNVFYTQTGNTLSFHFQADFTGAVTGNWIGSYMDQIGLQFGDANNNGPTVISGFTPTLAFNVAPDSAGETNTTGGWTGYTDKAGGNSPCVVGSLADAICYQINPGNIGEAGDQIVAAEVYDWYFDVTFLDDFDIAAMLAGSRSIKMQTFRLSESANGKCGALADGSPDPSDADCWKNAGQFSQSGIYVPGDDDGDELPEPGSLALLGLGLLGLGMSRRRQSK